MKYLFLVALLLTACGSTEPGPDALQLIVQKCTQMCAGLGFDFDYEVTKRKDSDTYCQCKNFGDPDSACIDSEYPYTATVSNLQIKLTR